MPGWAGLVLGWVTAREYAVSWGPFCFELKLELVLRAQTHAIKVELELRYKHFLFNVTLKPQKKKKGQRAKICRLLPNIYVDEMSNLFTITHSRVAHRALWFSDEISSSLRNRLLWMFCWLIALHSSASWASLVVPKPTPMDSWKRSSDGTLEEIESYGELVKNGRWSDPDKITDQVPRLPWKRSLVRRNKVTWNIHQLSGFFLIFCIGVTQMVPLQDF